jgi:hypothetical protein
MILRAAESIAPFSEPGREQKDADSNCTKKKREEARVAEPDVQNPSDDRE